MAKFAWQRCSTKFTIAALHPRPLPERARWRDVPAGGAVVGKSQAGRLLQRRGALRVAALGAAVQHHPRHLRRRREVRESLRRVSSKG